MPSGATSMSERLPSDSTAITTHRAAITRLGGTRRQCLRLPPVVDDDVDAGDRLRVVIEGTEYHAVVGADDSGRLLEGAFDNPRLARTTGEGSNRLAAWLRTLGRSPGDSVELDVVVAGEQYGLRAPGERAVYTVRQGPRDSLASIADGLDDEY